jgi:hypothetical protein
LFAHGGKGAAEDPAQRPIAESKNVFDAAVIHLFEVTERKRCTVELWQRS